VTCECEVCYIIIHECEVQQRTEAWTASVRETTMKIRRWTERGLSWERAMSSSHLVFHLGLGL